MLWLSGVVVDVTFTSGGVDMRACLIVDHCRVNGFTHVLIFVAGLNREIILRAKFPYLWYLLDASLPKAFTV